MIADETLYTGKTFSYLVMVITNEQNGTEGLGFYQHKQIKSMFLLMETVTV